MFLKAIITTLYNVNGKETINILQQILIFSNLHIFAT